jgi:hypothetical protein
MMPIIAFGFEDPFAACAAVVGATVGAAVGFATTEVGPGAVVGAVVGAVAGALVAGGAVGATAVGALHAANNGKPIPIRPARWRKARRASGMPLSYPGAFE